MLTLASWQTDTARHVFNLRNILTAREMSDDVIIDLPEIGFVAYHDLSMVAAGFIRRVEGQFALLDSLITNPRHEPPMRDAAIEMVVAALIEQANKEGIQALFAFSIDKNTLERAEQRHGFVRLPHAVIKLEL